MKSAIRHPVFHMHVFSLENERAFPHLSINATTCSALKLFGIEIIPILFSCLDFGDLHTNLKFIPEK